MKIKSITPSQKVKERFYVDFENGEKLTVTTNEMAQFGLYSGMVLDEETYASLVSTSETSRVRGRALRIISSRPMSEKELTDRLTAKGETEENAQDAVAWLVRLGFINDGDYASMIVRHYSAKGWGLQKIKSELYHRGIPAEYWDRALEELSDPQESIQRILETKLRGKTPDEKTLKKTTDMLRRRGFSWSDIKAAMADYRETMGDMEDEF